jgi:hypothetical protein
VTAQNDITGDKIKSKPNSDAYRDNYDKAFRKQTPEEIEALRKLYSEAK